MRIFTHIVTGAIAVFLTVSVALGQKTAGQSRLSIGKDPKKTNANSNLLGKNSLPKSLTFNSKTNYTQYYRDLLIVNKSKQQDPKSTLSSAAESNVEKNKISNVYPNPADSYTTLDYVIDGDYNSASLSFYNLLGKPVADFDLTKSSEKIRINTSGWESGFYMYQLIVNGKKIATKKLLVRHN
ncbi:MAG: T9SS type A sorting domain-containing protein [Cytophagaceae bacterium]|nr:T9SS type A sorting domain-containing protein [Cytophagaceae bacterium]MBL0326232.1 T9SS type A sorting domain-containing protein [Cytophagaceae bacterium]